MDISGIEVKPAGDGCRLRVRVHPGARTDGLVGIHGGALKLAVTAPPEKGRANEAAVRVLASALGLPRSAVTVISGLASRNKTIHLSGLDPGELRARLEAL